MASFYYNFGYALNAKPTYTTSDIIDMEVKMRVGRSMIANSFRVNGILQVSKVLLDGTTIVPITKQDQVFLDPYCGVHSLFRNVSTLVNGSSIENISYYPRWAGMKKQAGFTLESLNTSSDALVELCGTQNNIMLLGTPNTFGNDETGVSFSFKPYTAVNGSVANLPQSKFPSIRTVFNMVSPLEALYTTHLAGSDYMTNPLTGFSNLTYSITQLQCTWYESQEVAVPSPMTFETCSLITSTMLTSYATFAMTAANLYSALSLSFIQQKNRNNLYANNNLCEFVPGIEPVASKGQVLLLVDSNNAVATYPLQSYADIAKMYAKSLGAGMKNSITNAYLSKVLSFGIGAQYAVSENDRLSIQMIVDPNQFNPSVDPMDVFMYLSGFIQV
jgi:hypothetical protein